MHRVGQIALFLGIFIAIIGGVHFYIWIRLIHATSLPAPWSRVATIAVLILGLSLPATFLLSRALPESVARAVLFVPYLWMGMMFLFFFFLLATDVLRALTSLGLWASGHTDLLAAAGRRVLVARVLAGTVMLAVAGCSVVAVHTALARPVVREVRVELPHLPASMSGFTIVQLTDLHVGPTLGEKWLRGVVGEVNALRPDLVAITGDLVDGSVPQLRAAVAPIGELKAPHGVFFITGNHEFYSGVGPWLAELRRLGVQVLENERVAISRGAQVTDGAFDLAGVHDYSAHTVGNGHYRADLPKALAGRDPTRALVLLAHQPRAARQAAELGVGLQLSGHTHGGQIWPWRYLVYLQQPWVSGRHRVGATTLYVSDGTGFWGPAMRLGTSAEITRVTLVAPAGGTGKQGDGETGSKAGLKSR
ncbi:MAG TPA: metallophosphoesterase [Polyangia bacterium]